MDEIERQEVLRMVDRFARERVRPRASDIDRTGVFPSDLYEEAASLGLFSLWIPEADGGSGPEMVAPLLISERLSRESATFALIYSNCGDAVIPIVHAGTEAVRRDYLPGIAQGKLIPCFALSEAQSGSDAASITTRAERHGASYILNGAKAWCTNGQQGDVYIVFAKTDPQAGHKGISAFVVPRDAPGFIRGPDEELLGLRGSSNTPLFFENVKVPEVNRLGEEGEGFKLAMVSLDEARLNCSAMALGVATAALELAVGYAKDRVQFGRPIIQHQGVQFLLAEMTAEVAAARALWDRALIMLDKERSREASTFAAMSKLQATEAAMRVTTDAIQVMGGNGLSKVYPAERMMRDVKAFQIFDGTNQIQKMLIGRHLERHGVPFGS